MQLFQQLRGEAKALEELQEVIGDKAFQSLEQDGYFMFPTKDYWWLLWVNPPRPPWHIDVLYKPSDDQEWEEWPLHKIPQWTGLCVYAKPDEGQLPLGDQLMSLYRWITLREHEFIEKANPLGLRLPPWECDESDSRDNSDPWRGTPRGVLTSGSVRIAMSLGSSFILDGRMS